MGFWATKKNILELIAIYLFFHMQIAPQWLDHPTTISSLPPNDWINPPTIESLPPKQWLDHPQTIGLWLLNDMICDPSLPHDSWATKMLAQLHDLLKYIYNL